MKTARTVMAHPRPVPVEERPTVAVSVEDADSYGTERGSLNAFICSNGRIGFRAQKYDRAPATVHIDRVEAVAFLRSALLMAESDVQVTVDQTLEVPPR